MIVTVTTGSDPPELLQFAAQELSKYLRQLFDAQVTIRAGRTPSGENRPCFRLKSVRSSQVSVESSVSTDKATGSAAVLTDQGFMLRRVDDNTVELCGGSPLAALWAVYELVQSWGVAFTLHGDLFPPFPKGPMIPYQSAVHEPRQRLRFWRLINVFWTGPMSWSLKQQRAFIDQLLKQKYNGVYLCMFPNHPFVNFEVQGLRRTKASFNFDVPIPITEGNVGRKHLPKRGFFTNPEFVDCQDFEDLLHQGVAYATAIIAHAKSRGMYVSVAFQPFDIPREFAPLLEKPIEIGSGEKVGESGDIYNDQHLAILRAEFEAYLVTYPQTDIFEIHLPEHARTTGQFSAAWESLDQRFGLAEQYDIDELVQEETSTHLVAGGAKRGVNEGKMTIVMLDILHEILARTGYVDDLEREGKRLALSAGLSCQAILPVVSRALWPHAHLRIHCGYTSSRGVRTLRYLEDLDTSNVTVEQIITLQDDNVGMVAQTATSSIHRLIEFASQHGWAGYYTRFWPIGDLDPVSAYLSSASWNEGTTPENAYQAHIAAVYGQKAVGWLTQALRLLEDATLILDLDHLSLFFPVKDNMAKRFFAARDTVMTDQLWHVKSTYAEVGSLLAAARKVVSVRGSSHLDYWIGRITFSERALGGLAAIEEGNRAHANGNRKRARSCYAAAIAAFESALQALADNIRDDSDRGALAVYYDSWVRESEKVVKRVFSE